MPSQKVWGHHEQVVYIECRSLLLLLLPLAVTSMTDNAPISSMRSAPLFAEATTSPVAVVTPLDASDKWARFSLSRWAFTLEATTSCAVLAAISWEQTTSSSYLPLPCTTRSAASLSNQHTRTNNNSTTGVFGLSGHFFRTHSWSHKTELWKLMEHILFTDWMLFWAPYQQCQKSNSLSPF